MEIDPQELLVPLHLRDCTVVLCQPHSHLASTSLITHSSCGLLGQNPSAAPFPQGLVPFLESVGCPRVVLWRAISPLFISHFRIRKMGRGFVRHPYRHRQVFKHVCLLDLWLWNFLGLNNLFSLFLSSRNKPSKRSAWLLIKSESFLQVKLWVQMASLKESHSSQSCSN